MNETVEGIIKEGKSVREAVERGLATLGLPEKDVHIIVLDEGARGLLRLFGARKARVQLVPAVTQEERVQRIVDGLLGHMGMGGQVEVKPNDNRIHVSIETAGLDGLLIGRHGQTLDALEHIIDRMVNRGCRERRRVTVDVGGYRRRHGSGSHSRPQGRDRKKKNSARRSRNSNSSARGARRRLVPTDAAKAD